MLDFTGKAVLVTGGGEGIGRAACCLFAGGGASVIAIERDAARADALRQSLGDGHVVLHGDVTVAGDIARLADAVDGRGDGLDVLVNNVGDFLGHVKPFERISDEEIDQLYAVNMLQIFRMTRAMIPRLRRRAPGSSIVSVSSIEGFRGIPNNSVYSAFKTGLVGFTKSLALELGPEGIRVNLVAPETTETAQVPMSQYLKPEHADGAREWIPLGRFGTPDDIANGIAFLASPMASWMTGASLNIDGGALAAGGWYRTLEGRWTNVPVIPTHGMIF
ncbi:NAD(P)-dependent dehydrogenase (short-subunit alcohol dehydrogenase family) [Sphingobium sp. OAS761]|uniref:SDR family NAD(P)-dependent oxidoreductase n=1 Tax=Sphingobium sp. OAS761 TaxID=2817901 RepID=UPI00209F0C6B|nr:SDR family oxidoreductase [Sphingobium sp. OAS761]MCP1471786.1 NAD(P)-dependent dehydrogenase (short-subunit alcohol dehydrogenase family) [Sphingobium sp. OAS761]